MVELLKKEFLEIGETLYSAKLKNGLQVFLIPKKGFKECCGTLMIKFGSIDTKFTKEKVYPEGIAHFLEHKLFEMEDGLDVSTLFTNLGADTNAFTSFDKTCFYFSTTENVKENVDLLQNFTLTTTFTDSSVEREREIIGQEIDMYQDDVNYRLYQGILGNLYPGTSLASDIAGTKESIQTISVKDLKENHETFYKPQHMVFLLTGDFDPEVTFSEIKQKQEKLDYKSNLQIAEALIPYHQVLKTSSTTMEVTMPKLAIGYRGPKLSNNQSLLRQKIALRVYFAMILGWTSQTYQKLYESGEIDDSFDFDLEAHPEFQFIIISLDTKVPIAMSNKIRQYLRNAKDSEDLSEKHLQTVKKELYGEFLRNMDSLDSLSNQFVNYFTEDETYFDFPNLLFNLTFEDILKVGTKFLKYADVTDFTIFPK